LPKLSRTAPAAVFQIEAEIQIGFRAQYQRERARKRL